MLVEFAVACAAITSDFLILNFVAAVTVLRFFEKHYPYNFRHGGIFKHYVLRLVSCIKVRFSVLGLTTVLRSNSVLMNSCINM